VRTLTSQKTQYWLQLIPEHFSRSTFTACHNVSGQLLFYILFLILSLSLSLQLGWQSGYGHHFFGICPSTMRQKDCDTWISVIPLNPDLHWLWNWPYPTKICFDAGLSQLQHGTRYVKQSKNSPDLTQNHLQTHFPPVFGNQVSHASQCTHRKMYGQFLEHITIKSSKLTWLGLTWIALPVSNWFNRIFPRCGYWYYPG